MTEIKQPMSPVKKILIFVGVLLFICCAVVCSWYVYISVYGDEKLISNTVNVGELTSDSGDKKYFIEVDYNSNANKNGLEKLDIKLNYFTDENTQHFYSQGLQYVANSPDEKINWIDFEIYSKYLAGIVSDYIDSSGDTLNLDQFINFINENNALTSYTLATTGWWIFGDEYKANYYKPFVNPETTSRYNYQSYDNYESTETSNPITDDSYFTLSLGETNELVYVRFKGDNYVTSKDFEVNGSFNIEEFLGDSKKIGQSSTTNYYNYSNVDYLSFLIYKQVQTLPAGTNGTYVFEFGDNMFKYNLFDKNGTEIKDEDSTKVINRIKSYYTIKINISADGARNASDSIFGVLHGSANYSLDGSTSGAGDYFQGKTVVFVDVYDFNLVHVEGEYYALKLKEEFLEEYLPYKNKIYLSVDIDPTILEDAGYKFAGFTTDSGLDNFSILKINQPKGVR